MHVLSAAATVPSLIIEISRIISYSLPAIYAAEMLYGQTFLRSSFEDLPY